MTDSSMPDSLFAPRVRWRCRRGMKEVEEVLIPFFEARYAHMDEHQKKIFVQLLEESDPDLYAWLLQQSEPANSDYRAMISQVLAYVSS